MFKDLFWHNAPPPPLPVWRPYALHILHTPYLRRWLQLFDRIKNNNKKNSKIVIFWNNYNLKYLFYLNTF